jgi:hypothetical protein
MITYHENIDTFGYSNKIIIKKDIVNVKSGNITLHILLVVYCCVYTALLYSNLQKSLSTKTGAAPRLPHAHAHFFSFFLKKNN